MPQNINICCYDLCWKLGHWRTLVGTNFHVNTQNLRPWTTAGSIIDQTDKQVHLAEKIVYCTFINIVLGKIRGICSNTSMSKQSGKLFEMCLFL